MMANVVGCGPTQVSVGMEVEVTFEERGGGWWVPQFRLRAKEEG